MNPKLYIYSHFNHLNPRTAIARVQKQFIQIAFAVHLSAVISAERYRSDSGALKSAVLTLVYFYIIMIVHKCQQSAAQSCLRTFELRVLPFGKTSGAKLLNFISCHLSDVFPLLEGSGKTMAFENRRNRYKELDKKVPQAYRAYGEETFLPCDAGDARIFVNVELDEETGLYYYGARYLDPKYSRWLRGDPAVTDYMAGTSAGEGGVYNTVNLNVYHYAGNNPVKYTDPDGRELYNSSITLDEYNDSSFLKQQYTWKQVQGYFEQNPNGYLYRCDDEIFFKGIESKNDIIDPNSANMLLVDIVLVGKILKSFGKIAFNVIKQSVAKKTTETAAKSAIMIGGREYSKHALERMAERKLVPMIVEETIKHGTRKPGNTANTFIYFTDEAKVIVNELGKVITVTPQ